MGTTKRSLGIFTLAAIVTSVPFAQTVGSRGFQQERDQAAAGREVTQSDVERWKQELTNWGRWGADDEIGTLNLITQEKRRQAAALVREGISVSLAHDAETEATIDGPRPYQVTPLGITADEIRISYHGFIHTHLDFLNHNFIGAAVSGHPARDHRRRDPDLVPRVHPHPPGLPEPQLHRRGRDLQRLPAGSRRGRGAGRPLPEHRAQREVGHRHPGRADRHGAVPERAVPGARHADLHRGHRGLGGGNGGDRLLRRRGGHPHRTLGPARRGRPLGRGQRVGRTARVGHSLAQGAGHRDTGWGGRAGHGAGRRCAAASVSTPTRR